MTGQEVTIDRLGAEGDGIVDGPTGPRYVPFALPGERWRIAADTSGGLGTAERATRSPDRAEPPCLHYGVCGGCTAQHMVQPLYERWKRGLVVAAFAHRGLDLADRIAPLQQGPAGRRRRATFTARRAGGRVILGYHARGSHDIVELSTCIVTDPAIVAALPNLRRIAERLLDDKREIRLAVTAVLGGLDVNVSGAPRTPDAIARGALAELSAAAAIVRLVVATEDVVLASPAVVELAGTAVEIPSGGIFLQASPDAETQMVEIARAATSGARHVVDLFAGTGTLSLALAATARITAIDSDAAALGALDAAHRRTNGLKPLEVRRRDLFREPLSRRELDDFDAVVLDPPRAGARAQAERIAQSAVPVVVYVSCSPATLARDVRTLVDGGYAIDRIVPVDQFVYTEHVEAVAVLSKPRPGRRQQRRPHQRL